MFKKFFIQIFAFVFFVLVLASTSQAVCGLSLTANDINVSWDLNFSHVAVSVTVTRSSSEACSFALGFSKGAGPSYVSRRLESGSHQLRYQLYKDSGLTKVLKESTDITSIDEVVEGGFPAGAAPSSSTVNYYFEVPLNLATVPSLVASGNYTDSFVIRLYEGSGPPFADLVDSKSVNVTVQVLPMIALSLVDPGASFQLGQLAKNFNFGSLSEGSSGTVDLRVRTNAGFSVTFSSTNNGRLKHTTPGKNSYVPYKLYVNGANLNLSTSSTVPVVGLSGSGATGLSGFAYPLKVVIGSVTGAGVLSGPHSDDITITATTTE